MANYTAKNKVTGIKCYINFTHLYEQEPVKRIAHPCPFYARGRCLFADSCNFLHDTNAQSPNLVYPLSDKNDHAEVAQGQTSLRPSHAPTSTPTTTSLSSPRSPTRSPCMSGLLLALTPDDDKGDEPVSTTNNSFSDELHAYESTYLKHKHKHSFR
jgi:hypothetical protein